MKLRSTILIAFALLTFFSCEKDEKEPAPVTNNNGSGGSGNTPTPSNATSFSGIFSTKDVTNQYSTSVSSFTTINAYFSSQLVPGYYPTSAIQVNKVFFNGDSLPWNSTLKYYTNFNLSIAAETWSVDGANGISSFSFTNNFVTPTFSIVGGLPDSVYKSGSFSVIINNVANATNGYISILDGTNTVQGFYTASLSVGNNTITITASNMAALTANTGLERISVSVTNSKVFNVGGKNFQFNREVQWLKSIKIKP